MKILKTCAFGVLLILSHLHGGAQSTPPIAEPDYNKPKFFSDLPAKMTIHLQDAENLFALPVGTAVNTQVSDALRFRGTIVSKSNGQDAAVKSVVVRSSMFQGVAFTFTRIVNPDGTYKYLGRILGRNNGDAYEIVSDNGVWVLQKSGFYDVMND